MGHNDGANDAHGLEQLLSPAARAVGQENALQHLHLPRPHHHVLETGGKGHCELAPTLPQPSDSGDAPWVSPASTLQGKRCPQLPPSHLIAEGQGHDGDEKAEESLQFTEP